MDALALTANDLKRIERKNALWGMLAGAVLGVLVGLYAGMWLWGGLAS